MHSAGLPSQRQHFQQSLKQSSKGQQVQHRTAQPGTTQSRTAQPSVSSVAQHTEPVQSGSSSDSDSSDSEEGGGTNMLSRWMGQAAGMAPKHAFKGEPESFALAAVLT